MKLAARFGFAAFASMAILLAGQVSLGGPATSADVDLDVVFRCAGKAPGPMKSCRETRDMIINNCTVCHTFVPIVMQQFEPEGWDSLLHRHVAGDRVGNLKETQVKTIREFLVSTFNTAHEPPELPEELLATWTSY